MTATFRRMPVGRRVLALALAAALGGSLVGVSPARASSPSPSHPGRPPASGMTSVPVHPVASKPIPAQMPAGRTVSLPAPLWPQAGSAVVDLSRAATAPDGSSGAWAGQLPVWIGAAAGNPAPAAAPLASLGVQVMDRATTATAGVRGVLLALSGASAGQVPVSVDYSAFRTAFGADWSSRLRLVQLPACALSSPQRAECQTQAALATSHNDYQHQVVSASVNVPAGGKTVLALAAGPSGALGSYKASSLSASSTWQAGLQTGDFTWSYPIEVPPGLGALAPSIALSYDSGSVDGLTAATNDQASWIGEGFDFQPGFVERKYKACADEGKKTGDECWGTDNATVLLNGRATQLVKDDSSGTWRLQNDDGSRVEHLYNAGNRAHNGEYWKITATDGTQYFFGLNHLPGWSSGKPETNSTLKVPVYGLHGGDPCNDAPGGWCYQAYRWNLDLVVDPHANAETLWYQTDTNDYARDHTGQSSGTRTAYDRAGELLRMEYGLRSSDTYAPSPMRVEFKVNARCGSNSQTKVPCDSVKQDVPIDLSCSSGSCSNNTSPSFWSDKELDSIVTEVREGSSFANVDTYSLKHEFLDTGDGSFPLTLDSITRTGDVNGSAALPAIKFGYQSLANRVDLTNLPAFNRNRIASVSTESGSVIAVTYSGPGCTKSSEPEPDANQSLCFPQWSDVWPPPPAHTKPDWMTKYAVTDVSVEDATGASPAEVYHYDYLGGGAWHFDSDDGLVKESNKTWAQWRGFQKVVVTTGAAGGTQSQTSHLFMRAMNGDRTASGGTRSVQVTDSERVSIPDDTGLQGFDREEITYDGPGGAEVSAQVDDVLNSQTAKAVHTWGTVTANQVNVAVSSGRTDLNGGRGILKTRVDNTYDSYGILTQSYDQGDVAHPDPRGTPYSYARETANYLLTYPGQVLTTATACGGGLPSDPHLIVSDVRTSYDGQSWGSAPQPGGANPTRIQKVSSGGSGPSFVTVATNVYDQYGRVTSTADALNRRTQTTYAPASGGPVTQTTVVDPAGNATTTNLDPARGQAVQKIDVNNKSTTLAYDPLGRLIKVWLPGQNPPSAKPNATYSYTVSSSVASVVATSTLLANGSAYITNYQIMDGQLRPRQTQSPNQTGGKGRVIADTMYDSRGQVAKTNSAYYDGNTPPGGNLVTAFRDTDIPGQTLDVHDGAGRETAQVFRAYGIEQWRTSTGYGGDSTTVTPPAGGTAATTVNDARGQTVQLCHYHNLSPSGSCDAGSSDSTAYTHYPNGLLASVTDPAGNRWRYDYDTRGRKVSASDPDTGNTTYTYDDSNQLTSSTDARGQTLSYVYDTLGHKTQEWSGAVGSGILLASWSYNTSGSNLEQLASSTRFKGGNAYATAITGYDNAYRPTGVNFTIPASEGKLAGTYSFGDTYNVDGTLATETYPAAGGLAAETVTHSYDGVTGLPVKTLGLTDYVEESEFTEFGQPRLLAFGASSTSRWTFMQYTYDLPTKRLNQTQVSRDVNPGGFDANIHYRYDPQGNVLSAADTPTSGAADVQCFLYDSQRRLTEAWAQGSSPCAATPSAAILGGSSSYWDHLAYDVTGNRTSETITYAPGNTVSYGNGYPAAGQNQPHTLTNQNVTTTAYGSWTDTRTYDAAGDTQTIKTPHTNQALSWNQQGDLAGVVDSASNHTTTYVYDTGGKLLVRHDDAAATLELPGEELSLSAGGQVTASRYYTHAGGTVAVRTPNGLTWLLADPHDTDTIGVDALSKTQTLTERRFDPFGDQRAPLPPSWPGDRGFVGGTVDATTGFTNLGAREYDPVNGRFLSADPVLDTKDPQQMNGYAYANNNPTTNADPSGLMFVAGGGCLGSIQYCEGHSVGGGPAAPAIQYRPPWMSGTTFMMGAPPPPPPPPPPPRPARPTQPSLPTCEGRAGALNGSCTPAPMPKGGGGMSWLKNMWGWAKDAYHWVLNNRGLLASIGAIGACFFGPVACMIANGIAYAVRADQRIQKYGFSRSLDANIADGLLTYVGTFSGAAAAYAVAAKGPMFAGAEALPFMGRVAVNQAAALPSWVVFGATWIPRSDREFFIK